MHLKKILGIESSCDDSSVAIVNSSYKVESLFSTNQIKEHQIFKGVVPEIASRTHTKDLLSLVELCFKETNYSFADIDAIAVTSKPGLVGSLMVGTTTAKTLALAQNIPFLGVNHLEGHMVAPFLQDTSTPAHNKLTFPFLALIVSGGHTHIYSVKSLSDYCLIGKTLDDAAGEALDKFAQLLGLTFPGGAELDKLATHADSSYFNFPRPLSKEKNANLSFSGLKAAGSRLVSGLSKKDLLKNKAHLAASYQRAVVDTLIKKLQQAQEETQLTHIVVSGGVSANSLLRQEIKQWCKNKNLHLSIPSLKYCTDNAAMIAFAGYLHMKEGLFSNQYLSPTST
ncbi:MAG: tRNA (adenosine(37)-N6)-threonylcarbamoyltransferase complex transferase subunit TsaD [Bdellovibrionaceae bacterium]|nr:tRNA (adenosine(37)-N6)-threonylcarbamoyltransferase complex transferase subunit TsaD [Pseudobdellovibrionaceae bacterium]